jgi:putative DNA primase/helicase
MKRHGIHDVKDVEAATVRVEPPACDWIKDVAAGIPDKPAPPPLLSKKARPAVERLAGLPIDVYEAERKGAAEKLGMRASALDTVVKTIRQPLTGGQMHIRAVEPAPDPVDGAQLLEEIAATIERYMKLPSGGAVAIALWILHSHAIEAAFLSPILLITSPVYGCGKTTLLTILRELVQRPLPTSNISPAALFRCIEAYQPVLLIDEADSFAKLSDELRNILNAGHTRPLAYVVRTTGENHEPKSFNTFGPKVLAAIGKMPPTIVSRSIQIKLKRLAVGESVERLRPDRLDHLTPLAQRAVRWAIDHIEELRSADPELPSTLRLRHADNWRPLIGIADAAGGDWPRLARHAAELLDEPDDDDTLGLALLADIRDLFTQRGEAHLSSEAIVAHLNKLENRRWAELPPNGKSLSKNRLATLLKQFEVTPRGVRVGDRTPKGYARADFADAFLRYLPPNEPQQRNNADAS